MNRFLLLILTIFIVTPQAFSQNKPQPDSVGYLMRTDYDLANSQNDAQFFRLIVKAGKGMFDVQDYYLDSKPRLIAKSSTNQFKFQPGAEGDCTEYFKNGQIKSLKKYQKGKIIGDAMEYYPNGKLYNLKNYPEDVRVYLKKCLDSTGKVLTDNGNGNWIKFNESFGLEVMEGPVIDGREHGLWIRHAEDIVIYKVNYENGVESSEKQYTNPPKEMSAVIEKAPSFPGGDAAFGKFLARAIKYPTHARNNNIQGRVIVTFVVERDGSLSDVKIIRSPDESLSTEALRVMQLSPKWVPGIQNNLPVRVQYSVPIGFSLTEDKPINATEYRPKRGGF